MAKKYQPTNCDGCGVCCMHMATPPYSEAEYRNLMQNHNTVFVDLLKARESRRMQWEVHGQDFIPCGFLDMVTRQCRHYEHRPEICRDFELGGDDCMAFRKKALFQV